ncbi:substrate-binding domain-containing protein [Roseibium sp. SCPC15]|uniref:substrate-binding domain-containing protein n=1 Tax=Roseibium sp. SCP15 TaxID=3141376 RepID=UPI003338566A
MTARFQSTVKVFRLLAGIVAILLSFYLHGVASAAETPSGTLDEFWTLEEFTRKSPKQQMNAEAFAERVAGDAVALSNSGKTVRIAVIYPGSQTSDYWRRSVVSFEARLKKLGVSYEIVPYFSGSSSFVGNQASLITAALKADPDYLVFTLDALRHKAIVQRLIARSRPKVILQNITTPVKSWRDKQPFLYVGFDHVAGTNLLIDYYKKRFGHQKPFAILYGPRGYVSRARGNTFLQAYSDPEVLNLKASYYVGYDRQKSREATTRILADNPDLAFIYACSTDIALGALDAIQEDTEETQVVTNGWGGGSAELEAIAKGDLDVTVMRMNDDNGVAMAEAIALDQAGLQDEVPVVYSGGFELVTSGDSIERIDELKARAFRYSK